MMISIPLAFAGLSMAAAMPAAAVREAQTPASAWEQTIDSQDRGLQGSSDAATRVVDWIAASGNNHSLPYIIVDKQAARAFLFDAEGKQVADAPVLIGRALGDDASPGIGTKTLAEIGPAEKTTPAGRFLAKFGWAGRGHEVLWVDYATSVALHTIPVGNKEHRTKRMLSSTIEDNRITFGCINVPKKFYYGKVRPFFRNGGGYVYVLPDTKPLEAVFPLLRLQKPNNVSVTPAPVPAPSSDKPAR